MGFLKSRITKKDLVPSGSIPDITAALGINEFTAITTIVCAWRTESRPGITVSSSLFGFFDLLGGVALDYNP